VNDSPSRRPFAASSALTGRAGLDLEQEPLSDLVTRIDRMPAERLAGHPHGALPNLRGCTHRRVHRRVGPHYWKGGAPPENPAALRRSHRPALAKRVSIA
jgi:hypothetical protein